MMGKETPYFKHDALASLDVKMVELLNVEKLKGYGLYWLLMEMLRLRPEYKIALSEMRAVAHRLNTQQRVLKRVIENYGLFELENGYFFSPELSKRLQVLGNYSATTINKQHPQKTDNSLIVNEVPAIPARIQDKTRQEKNFCSSSRDFPLETIGRSETDNSAEAVHPVGHWEALVDEMQSGREWMDMIGMHSGLGKLFIEHQDRVVELFRNHIRLYDKGGGLFYLSHVRQYFANFLSRGSVTCKRVKETLQSEFAPQSGYPAEDANCFETLLDGQRTYLGHPIPVDAPPRPDALAVWDEHTAQWTR